MGVLDRALAAVSETGIAVIDSSVSETTMLQVARHVGEPAQARKALIEALTPTLVDNARPASLSQIYGKGAFPWHTDTAHWSNPARYLILGCSDIGAANVPTLVLHREAIELTLEERSVAHTSPFLIANGRRSFFSSICSTGRGFWRFDPGCMRPSDEAGARLMSKIQAIPAEDATAIAWRRGRIAIIDNWRCLHRRAHAEQAGSRQLLRVYAN